jgi:(2Fe-2S) ferredoxin
VYGAFKHVAMDRGVVSSVWITQTGCLGLCPKHGASVARYPRQAIVTEVTPADVPVLFDGALAEARRP